MKLMLVKQGDFLRTKCDFYVDEDDNIYMSRTQIGYALQTNTLNGYLQQYSPLRRMVSIFLLKKTKNG